MTYLDSQQDPQKKPSPQQKLESRRKSGNKYVEWGGGAKINIYAAAKALTNDEDMEFDSDEETNISNTKDVKIKENKMATLAIGMYFPKKTLIVARKGGTDPQEIIKTISDRIYVSTYNRWAVVQTASPGSGLHGEMAIIRYILEGSNDPKTLAWDLADDLQIACIGKEVCIDCAGWMNKHKIRHLSVVKKGKITSIKFECGKPSAGGMWEHPRTGATFKSRTNQKEGLILEHYRKGDTVFHGN